MLLESGADVAIINGGSIRASIAAGPVTKGDLIAVLPFGNTTGLVEVTGAELVAMLENGLAAYPEPSGAFPHVGGLTYSFAAESEPGLRTSDWMVGTQPLDLPKVTLEGAHCLPKFLRSLKRLYGKLWNLQDQSLDLRMRLSVDELDSLLGPSQLDP